MGYAKQPKSSARKLYDDTLCRKLRMALAATDMNMKELSKAAAIPYGTVYNILNRKCAPSAFALSKICCVLGIDANELLGVRRVRR